MEERVIDEFVSTHKNKKVVVVQGLGFVGAVMSLVVANSKNNEYCVIGVDLPQNKKIIDELNNGKFPIEADDPKIFEYFDNTRLRKNFYATSCEYAYSKADIIIVDINLDVSKASDFMHSGDFEVNLSNFKTGIISIAQQIKQNTLLIIETTVPPGTCKMVVEPIVINELKKRNIQGKIFIGHSYERVMPGANYIDSIENFYRVYSGIDEQSAIRVEDFLKTIIKTDQYPLTKLKNTNSSELSKVLENSFRAMNISFIQEWTEFAESAGIDLFEVIDAIRLRPTHKNIMYPGLGVGGYCLTKDPLLASWSSVNLFKGNKLNQSENAVITNDKMPFHTFKSISKFAKNKLKDKVFLLLGISYLKNIGDTRYTPVKILYEELKKKGSRIIVHDPYIEHWDDLNIHTTKLDLINFSEVDFLVITTPHDAYFRNKTIYNIMEMNKKLVVVDPNGSLPQSYLKKFNNHKYILIGKGNE